MTERLQATTIPEGVDGGAGQARQELFDKFMRGDQDGYQTYRDLLKLYWVRLPTVDEPTAEYLMDATFDIAEEASFDLEVARQIYEEEQRNHN